MTQQLNGGRVLARSWPLLLAGLVLGALIAFGVTFILPKSYTATSQLYIASAGGGAAGDAAQAASYIDSQLSAYQTLASSEVVLQPVIDKLGLDTTPGELADQVSVESTSSVLAISTSDPKADRATEINKALIEELTQQISELSPVTPDGQALVQPRVLSPATEPTEPSSPRTLITTGIGAALGLALAAAVAFARAAREASQTSRHGSAHARREVAIDPERE